MSKENYPATLPFQGIELEGNDELGVLERLFDSLEKAKFKKLYSCNHLFSLF